MIKALIAEKDGISLYAYIDEPINLVKYYTANNQTFYSYSKAKNFYDSSLIALSDNIKRSSQKILDMILKGKGNDSK